MRMSSDGELLHRYAEGRSEEAFAELVHRHLNLVYSAALRQLHGNAALAEDVMQSVFTDLARKATPLSARPNLMGWLYTSTHFAATKALRAEQRRHQREQEAQTMHDLHQDSDSDRDWAQVRPVLDQVMHELKSADREAILLRFFENRPLADVGSKLGLKENAARMRIERALEKLRVLLSRRGVTATAALSLILSTHTVHAAPIGMAASLTSTALASGASSAGLIAILLMKKLKFALAITVLLLLTGTTVYFTKPFWNRRTPSVSLVPTQPARVDASDTTRLAPTAIAGAWNAQGKPHLDLQTDDQGKVTGTVVWWDGPNGNRVPVETGTFDRNTGTLRLEGEGPMRDGVPLRYVITGTLENDTLAGEFALGSRKGNFAFTK
jgi:RNA polymerase sigma factor (sigma-70 family)